MDELPKVVRVDEQPKVAQTRVKLVVILLFTLKLLVPLTLKCTNSMIEFVHLRVRGTNKQASVQTRWTDRKARQKGKTR